MYVCMCVHECGMLGCLYIAGLDHYMLSTHTSFLYVHPSSLLMYMHREAPNRYDVVDVDPYGSPTDFLDSALQAVDDGGT